VSKENAVVRQRNSTALSVERAILEDVFEIGRKFPTLRVGPPTYCKITGASVTVTDGRRLIERTFEGSATLGPIFLTADRLGKIIQLLPDGPVGFTQTGKGILVEADGGRWTLPMLAGDLPWPPEMGEPHPVNGQDLAEALLAVRHAVHTDRNERWDLCGVCIQGVGKNTTRVSATDGSRMAVVDLPASYPGTDPCVIPTESVGHVVKVLEGASGATIAVGQGGVEFRNPDKGVKLLTERVETGWPDMNGPLDTFAKKSAATMVVRSRLLIAALRRAELVTLGGLSVVGLVMDDDGLHVRAETENGSADCLVPIEQHEGWVVQGRFSAPKVREALSQVGDTVELRIGGDDEDKSLLPLVILPDDACPATRVLMPCRA